MYLSVNTNILNFMGASTESLRLGVSDSESGRIMWWHNPMILGFGTPSSFRLSRITNTEILGVSENPYSIKLQKLPDFTQWLGIKRIKTRF